MVYLIGRLAKDVREDGITLAVQRSFKNEDGKYETDMIECTFDGQSNIAKNTQEYCKKGDLVGIKGSLRQGGIVAIEKISFLASKRK
jgi:single-strand DNA-binding protein